MHGRISLGISKFQDLCTVPMIATIPLLASGEEMPPAVSHPQRAAIGTDGGAGVLSQVFMKGGPIRVRVEPARNFKPGKPPKAVASHAKSGRERPPRMESLFLTSSRFCKQFRLRSSFPLWVAARGRDSQYSAAFVDRSSDPRTQ